MALKELQIRNLRPKAAIFQCTDDRGLYLEVHPNGSKLSRYKYRHADKQKRLALGRYPEISLAEARRRRDDARRQVESGTDPLAERKREKLVAAFHTSKRPMSENTVNQAFRRMGFGPGEITAHGLRTTASTLLNESGKWSIDAIERSLAHADTNSIRGIYNWGRYWDERVEMHQWWSDHLDQLRAKNPRENKDEPIRAVG